MCPGTAMIRMTSLICRLNAIKFRLVLALGLFASAGSGAFFLLFVKIYSHDLIVQISKNGQQLSSAVKSNIKYDMLNNQHQSFSMHLYCG